MEKESTEKRLKEITHKITGLPTLPQVVGQITHLMQNPRTSAEEVGRAITMDQSLASKVLKLVNSAFYGFPGRINTITHAIVILGFNTVKNIVLTASIFDAMGGKGKMGRFDLEKFWLHSIGTGILAKEIARKVNFKYFEESFLGGLLHDVGKVIFYRFLADEFEETLSRQERDQSLLRDAEKKTLGITHCEVGGWLAEKWNLPEDLRHVILYHHAPVLSTKYDVMVSIVHMADVFARALSIGSGGDNKLPVISKTAWEKLRFSRQLLDKIYQDIDAEVEKAQVFFQIM